MSDQRPVPPEVGVLLKQKSQLEGDLANLRKGMVQQLNASARLLKCLFAIDEARFGGRYQAERTGERSHHGDLLVATAVVEALQQDLPASGEGDRANLGGALQATLSAARDLASAISSTEAAAHAAAGMPGSPTLLTGRDYPLDDPSHCLGELAGFLGDVKQACLRLKDRVQALALMVIEAEAARASDQHPAISRTAEEIAGDVATLLREREQELHEVRRQAIEDQERAANLLDRATTDYEQHVLLAREQAAREADLRQAAIAEIRSLAAEIQRLASDDPEAIGNDDLDITLGVLRESLSEDGEIETLVPAAESVLVGWSELVLKRQERMAQERDHWKQKAEQHDAADRAASVERDDLRRALKAAEEQRTTASASARSATDHDRQVGEIKQEIERERAEAQRQRTGRVEAETRAQAAMERARAAESTAKTLEAAVREAQAKVDAAERRVQQVQSGSESERRANEAELIAAREAAEAAANQARTDADAARREAEEAAAAAQAAADAARASTEQLKAESSDHARTRVQLNEVQRAMTSFQKQLESVQQARDAAVQQASAAEARMVALIAARESADRARAAGESERQDLATRLADLERRLSSSDRERLAALQEREQLRATLTGAQLEAAKQMKARDAALAEREAAMAEREAAYAEREAAMAARQAAAAERDAAKRSSTEAAHQLTLIQAERDRLAKDLSSTSERARIEAAALQRKATEQGQALEQSLEQCRTRLAEAEARLNRAQDQAERASDRAALAERTQAETQRAKDEADRLRDEAEKALKTVQHQHSLLQRDATNLRREYKPLLKAAHTAVADAQQKERQLIAWIRTLEAQLAAAQGRTPTGNGG